MSGRTIVIGAGFAGLAAADRAGGARRRRARARGARPRRRARVVGADRGAGRRAVIERGAEFVLDGYDVLRRLAAREGLALVDTGMSYYVREPRGVAAGTADLQAAGTALARAAEAGDGRSVAELVGGLGLPEAVAEAVLARVEISSAQGAERLAASVLEHVAAFAPLPSHRIAGGNQGLALALAAAARRPRAARHAGPRDRGRRRAHGRRRPRGRARDPRGPAPRRSSRCRSDCRTGSARRSAASRRATRRSSTCRCRGPAAERGDERAGPLLVLDGGGGAGRGRARRELLRRVAARARGARRRRRPRDLARAARGRPAGARARRRRRAHDLGRRPVDGLRLHGRRPRAARRATTRRSPRPPARCTSPASTPPATGARSWRARCAAGCARRRRSPPALSRSTLLAIQWLQWSGRPATSTSTVPACSKPARRQSALDAGLSVAGKAWMRANAGSVRARSTQQRERPARDPAPLVLEGDRPPGLVDGLAVVLALPDADRADGGTAGLLRDDEPPRIGEADAVHARQPVGVDRPAEVRHDLGSVSIRSVRREVGARCRRAAPRREQATGRQPRAA